MKNKKILTCKGSTGGIKNIYIIPIPLSLDKVNFMSELNEQEAKEAKERAGIDCIILSPSYFKLIKEIKQMIIDAESSAEECFQEIDDEEQGNYYLAKVDALKDVIKMITGNKPILNNFP